jgi:16S rRNA (adenine1518-N6/adenine1519-N6)-dimethyltransferase
MLKAKKSLGQNFLRNDKAISDIVNSISNKYESELQSGDIEIIEIGGGEGVVTRAMLERGYTMSVLELDPRAVEEMSSDIYLAEKINEGKLKIYKQDVLETDFSELVNSKKYIVIGNIPYYITGLIFRHIFEQEILPLEVTLMVQKEVAERVARANEKQNLLSLSVNVYGESKIVSIVKAGSFVPPPKVDSAIINIKNIVFPFKNEPEERLFFTIIKTAFKHPRKIALSNLKKYLNEIDTEGNVNLEKQDLYIKIEKYFIENNLKQKRAEDIPLSTWLDILNIK